MKPIPETRIRVVEQYKDIRYYPEYKQVIIPHLWWEWHSARVGIEDKDYLFSQIAAEWRINRCIEWWKECRIKDEDRLIRKKEGKRVWFIKYPEGLGNE